MLAHNAQGPEPREIFGSAKAMSGAAMRASTMCCATRAEKSDTDKAQSGDINAAEAISQPAAAKRRVLALEANSV